MKRSAILMIALLLAACAQTDPYARLEPAPTPELSAQEADAVFEDRWPAHFKCVQTVTIDFGVQTRTLVGYLIVQHAARFRLQGMTEHGLKLFDVAYDEGRTTRVFSAEEFDGKVLDNIVRDTGRAFLGFFGTRADSKFFPPPSEADPPVNWNQLVSVTRRDSSTRITLHGRRSDLLVNAVGDPPRVDWYAARQSGRDLYRVDHYEWRDFDGLYLPSVIVLCEPGIQSDGPPYKLTIKVTELTPRDTPWPDRVFSPEGE
jgi:hypothetical protein